MATERVASVAGRIHAGVVAPLLLGAVLPGLIASQILVLRESLLRFERNDFAIAIALASGLVVGLVIAAVAVTVGTQRSTGAHRGTFVSLAVGLVVLALSGWLSWNWWLEIIWTSLEAVLIVWLVAAGAYLTLLVVSAIRWVRSRPDWRRPSL